MGRTLRGLRRAAAALTAALIAPATAGAQETPRPAWFDSGRLLRTAGIAQLEGAAGGGLTPWATIAGYGTRNVAGGTAHATAVVLPDFPLHTAGVAVGLFNRLELSYARQWFDTRDTGRVLGLRAGYTFEQDGFGLKLRLLGDAV